MVEDIRKAFDRWTAALAERDPEKIVACYHQDAVLWGTFSTKKRKGNTLIREYFEQLVQRKKLRALCKNLDIRIYGDIAVNSGMYYFNFVDNNRDVMVPARYTFVYQKTDGEWLIIEHHSSVLPPENVDLTPFIKLNKLECQD
jgi:uncharacterized protein (TIGR02246 family)